MNRPAFISPKIIAVAVIGFLGLGAGIWRFTESKHEDAKPKVDIPKEFTIAALKNTPPEQGFDTFRKAMEREDLTEEQKRQIRENADEVREKFIDDRINDYFASPKEDRNKILDKQIDEMEKFRKRMEEERDKREAERDQMTEEQRQKERERWQKMREGRPEPTQAERKTFTESRSAGKTAQRMAYRQAMSDRMKERGIEPPRWGGPGGPGGRGGGGGGGGGGG